MVALLLKASLILALLVAFYKLFLEKESFFAANRIYLIGCILISFSLPFVSLPKLVNDQGYISTVIERSKALESPASTAGFAGDTQDVIPKDNIQDTNSPPLLTWIVWLYYFGAAILLLRLCFQVANVIWVIARAKDRVDDGDTVIVNMEAACEPHSFFNYIFINPAKYDFDTYEQIIAHEKIHVSKRHSFDLLLAEIATVALWVNPVVWMLRKDIEKNLEFETDDRMVNDHPIQRERYQLNLVNIATAQKPLSITTNYNQSLIKQRILRINGKRSNPHNYWKYVFTIPLLSVLLILLNKPAVVLASESVAMPEIESNSGVVTNDCSALLAAVKSKQTEQVSELLKSVDPDCSYRGDGEPRSPLVAAARQGNMTIGTLLLDAGADVGYHARGDETPLMAASARGHIEFVNLLVLKGADINEKLLGDGSALLVAARGGHLDVVKYLIQNGADVNSQVNGDGTPLICAVRNGHYEISQLLLEQGADPYLVSPGDEYAMYHARMSNDKRLIELLKKYEK